MAQPDPQLASPLAPIGVEAALRSASDPSFTPRATLLEKEFTIAGRVAVISGGNRGLGLEMAEALAEAGAIVYCLDLPASPGESWEATRAYVSKLGLAGGARLEYASVDVTDQQAIWDVVEKIAEKEGRMDVCVAAAGIAMGGNACLDYPAAQFEKIIGVNLNGVFYTAQAAGRQMVKYNRPGSIVLIASMAGSVALPGHRNAPYDASKAGVIQMARNLACELAVNGIRVNTISPGYIPTTMSKPFLDSNPHLRTEWASQNPLGRLGRPDELRGVIAWLASDASSFCTGSDILICGGQTAW
ncbi:NAD-binding protein [Phellopilus nigrolimitatus]|nr:NAD-binding protein [Phellopilus nigrolimitatus]